MRKVKELDPYIKGRVGEALIQLGELIKPSNFSGTSRVYYTGNWVQDIYDNYTDKQAETIFKKVEKLKPQLDFFQKKLEPFTDSDGKVWVGYDYIARKK
tara:strand:- start:44 stop:340 length:297 start_codon:yes stop_codon:yes gene_type:complete